MNYVLQSLNLVSMVIIIKESSTKLFSSVGLAVPPNLNVKLCFHFRRNESSRVNIEGDLE